jgi:hypothetical protein
MSKLSSLTTKLAIGGLSFLAMAGTVLAEDLTSSDYYDYYTTSADAATAATGAAALFTGGFLILWICCALIGLIFFALNIWMLIDVSKRTDAEVANRSLWLVLLIVGIFLGFGGLVAIIYFFAVRKKLVAVTPKK